MTRTKEPHLVRRAVETLRLTPAFADLPAGVLRELARVMHYRDYRRDEYVYYENDPGLGLYVVQQGRVRLQTAGAQGEPEVLHELGETDVFGEASLVGEFRRNETAQALTPARLLGLFRPDFKALVRRRPEVGAAVAMSVARHLAARGRVIAQILEARDGKVEALRVLHTAVPDVSTLAPSNDQTGHS